MQKYEKLKIYPLPTIDGYKDVDIEKFNEILAFSEKPNEHKRFQNERFENEGIPPTSIKLEVGKNYDGHADGNWEILTINGELWFCSDWCCVNFDEVNE